MRDRSDGSHAYVGSRDSAARLLRAEQARVDALKALEAACATEDLAAIDAALLKCAEVGLPDDADGTKTAAARREEVVLKRAEEKRVAAVAALDAAADVEAIDAALLSCTEAGVAEDDAAVVAAIVAAAEVP